MNERENSATKGLIDILDNPPYEDGTPCRVEFYNGMPNGSNVIIEKAGAEWTYDDGEKSSDALPNAYIGPGQTSYLTGLTKCTVVTKCIIFVRIPGKKDLLFFEDAKAADPDACQVLIRFGIKPKQSIAKTDFRSELPFEVVML